MKEFVIYLLKSGMIIGFFLLIYQLFMRKATFLKFNRMYLMFGLLASVVIPLIKIRYEVPVNLTVLDTAPSDAPAILPDSGGITLWMVVVGIYALGALGFALRNVFACRKLTRLIKSGEMKSRDGYHLVDSPLVKSPLSVFNYVLLDTQSISDTEKDLILKHELTHINQKHWIDLFCSECMLMLQWFNPFMWIYVILQKENHEFLADKSVIDEGVSPAVYQAVLINQQFGGPVFSFSNSFNYSNHLNRLIMIKKRKSAPWKRLAALAIVPIIGGFLLVSAQPKYVTEEFVMSNIPIQDGDGEFTMTNIPISEEDSILLIKGNVKKIKDEKGNEVLFSKDSIRIVGYGQKNTKGKDSQIVKLESSVLIIDDPKSKNWGNKLKGSLSDIETPTQVKDKLLIPIHGEKGRSGVMAITIEDEGSKKDGNLTLKSTSVSNGGITPLVLLDGKEISMKELEAVDAGKIESISVLKDKSATEIYGEKGKNGVIIITSKKAEFSESKTIEDVTPAKK